MIDGIIFSNLHDDVIPELTKERTMASLPFGCRYRLIDFPLSNMVNSGINNVYVVTQRNYQSLTIWGPERTGIWPAVRAD